MVTLVSRAREHRIIKGLDLKGINKSWLATKFHIFFYDQTQLLSTLEALRERERERETRKPIVTYERSTNHYKDRGLHPRTPHHTTHRPLSLLHTPIKGTKGRTGRTKHPFHFQLHSVQLQHQDHKKMSNFQTSIHEYLETLPLQTFNRLYQKPATCLAIFRYIN